MQKIIHYCWLGNQKPEKVKYCIESWKKICPQYEIKEWNESNYDVNKNKFTAKAYADKKYAFVSDYMRFDILYNYGGIYLDTDVELLKDITPLTKDNFMGLESPGNVASGLIICCEKGNEIFKEILQYYDNMDVTDFNYDVTVVDIVSDILRKYGLNNKNEKQQIKDIVIYPTEYFNPKGESYGKEVITKNTYSIHHYMATWKTPLDQKIMKYKVKYGVKKGKILFAINHPILTIKKIMEKNSNK